MPSGLGCWVRAVIDPPGQVGARPSFLASQGGTVGRVGGSGRSDFSACVSSRVERLDEELQATRKGERTQGPEAEAVQVLNATHRQMQQGAAGSCDASGVCTARIITRTVVMQSAMSSGGGGPQRGRRAQAAPCDFAAESAAVMDVCCASGGGEMPPTPAPAPAPPPAPTPTFHVDDGPCELLGGGSCVGRPYGYSDSEQCTITATSSMTLAACPVFRTERGFDMLVIDGSQYDATNCPEGVRLSEGDEITWRSDGSVASDGWEICASGDEGGDGYGGHRRAQADCPLPEVCPSTRCAEVFQSFYSGCSAELEASPELGAGLAALSTSCSELLGGSSLAHQLNLQCTDTSLTTEDCVPPCNAEYHGYMLLLNIDGDDSKFSCNLAHGLYSWMGAASEGGYLGADAQSFVSAVVSGAAGTYVLSLMEDADIVMDLVVELGQNVVIRGYGGLAEAPRWGSGSFYVGASLILAFITLDASTIFEINSGGSLSLSMMTVPIDALLSATMHPEGVSARVSLSAVNVLDTLPSQDLGELTGTITTGTTGIPLYDPPGFLGTMVRPLKPDLSLIFSHSVALFDLGS